MGCCSIKHSQKQNQENVLNRICERSENKQLNQMTLKIQRKSIFLNVCPQLEEIGSSTLLRRRAQSKSPSKVLTQY